MNNYLARLKTPNEIAQDFATKLKLERKRQKLSQQELAIRSNVSLGSIKRFEASGQIALVSLIKILKVLHLDVEFASLYTEKKYNSIQDIINEQL